MIILQLLWLMYQWNKNQKEFIHLRHSIHDFPFFHYHTQDIPHSFLISLSYAFQNYTTWCECHSSYWIINNLHSHKKFVWVIYNWVILTKFIFLPLQLVIILSFIHCKFIDFHNHLYMLAVAIISRYNIKILIMASWCHGDEIIYIQDEEN